MLEKQKTANAEDGAIGIADRKATLSLRDRKAISRQIPYDMKIKPGQEE